jgi:cytochrome c biogenesis protein CcdA
MQKYVFYRSIGAGAVFMILGIVVLLFGNNINQGMPKEIRIILAVILILYGVYRIVRGFTKARMENEEIE